MYFPRYRAANSLCQGNIGLVLWFSPQPRDLKRCFVGCPKHPSVDVAHNPHFLEFPINSIKFCWASLSIWTIPCPQFIYSVGSCVCGCILSMARVPFELQDTRCLIAAEQQRIGRFAKLGHQLQHRKGEKERERKRWKATG